MPTSNALTEHTIKNPTYKKADLAQDFIPVITYNLYLRTEISLRALCQSNLIEIPFST